MDFLQQLMQLLQTPPSPMGQMARGDVTMPPQDITLPNANGRFDPRLFGGPEGAPPMRGMGSLPSMNSMPPGMGPGSGMDPLMQALMPPQEFQGGPMHQMPPTPQAPPMPPPSPTGMGPQFTAQGQPLGMSPTGPPVGGPPQPMMPPQMGEMGGGDVQQQALGRAIGGKKKGS